MKFSQYNYSTECKNGIVLVNTSHSNYVKFTKKEELEHFKKLHNSELPLDENDYMVKALYEKGYIVDDNVNEYEIEKKGILDYISKNDKKLKLIIYVTDQCNFRCIYCPVKYQDEKLSDENWEAVYKNIEKGVNSGEYTVISISFFGGEPLLEANNIINCLDKLQNLSKQFPNIKFAHEMTTNGYFLTPEIYDKLVECNVIYYQITLDGFAETHNKMRPLAGGQETWDRIVENLKYINTRKDNAQIILRANYNKINLNSLEKYKEWQKKTFDNPKFKFLYHPVVGFSELVPEEQLTDKNSQEVKDVEKKIKNGMNIFKKYAGICQGCDKHSYTISVDGNISKCNNLHGSRDDTIYIGKLAKDGDFIFNERIKAWFENYELEECKDCLIYPLCCARTCPLQKIQFPDTRPDCSITKESWIQGIKDFMENNL